jgi:hypothetical protein
MPFPSHSESHQKNLAHAQGISDQIKQKTVCSEDIIPHIELPFIPFSINLEASLRFGKKRLNTYYEFAKQAGIIRTNLLAEAERQGLAVPQISAAIACTRLGIGECGELAQLAFLTLIKKNQSNVVLVGIEGSANLDPSHPKPHQHLLVLFGGETITIKKDTSLLDFNTLDDDVIVLDPYLNHVGQANQYLKEQSAYIATYAYNIIFHVDRVTENHHHNLQYIEGNVRTLLDYAKRNQFHAYDRSILESLPKRGKVEGTALLNALNRYSTLKFEGTHQDYKVNAMTSISTTQDEKLAKKLQSKLSAGSFMKSPWQMFFVLPHINVKETDSPGSSLPDRIQRLT